jgi:hypothetical protein
MNDGYVYRLRYNEYEINGDTTTLVGMYDTEFYDTNLEDMRSMARNLKAGTNTRVTLTRKLLIKQPGWEEIDL